MAYLILMIVANSAATVVYLLCSFVSKLPASAGTMSRMPAWAFPVLALVGLFNVACAIALLRWKRWGFWGFFGSSVVVAAINIQLGLSIGSVLGGLVGLAILYGVLQIGTTDKGWPQLD